MKITKTSKGEIGKPGVTSGNTNVSQAPRGAFNTSLNKVSMQNHEVKIANLVDQISNQAEKLAGKVDIGELKMYKRLVSEFLDEAVNNSHKFMKENKLDRRGRNRVYAIIKRINGDLEDLTQEVLKDEKDNLLILQKLDDIRGLVLDIIT